MNQSFLSFTFVSWICYSCDDTKKECQKVLYSNYSKTFHLSIDVLFIIIIQGLLEFIWTGGRSGPNIIPRPSFGYFTTLIQVNFSFRKTLQQVQILGPFFCRLTDLSLLKGFSKKFLILSMIVILFLCRDRPE